MVKCNYNGEEKRFSSTIKNEIVLKQGDEIKFERDGNIGKVFHNGKLIAEKGDIDTINSFYTKLCHGEDPYKKYWFE